MDQEADQKANEYLFCVQKAFSFQTSFLININSNILQLLLESPKYKQINIHL